MRQVLTLLKKDFRNSFITRLPYLFKTKKERGKAILSIFLALMFGVYLYFGIAYIIDWIEGYDKLGYGNMYLMQALVVYTFFAIVSIFPYIISNFYFSNDVRIMLPLPIRSSNIILSKIAYTSLGLLSLALIIVMPFAIRFASFYGKSFIFYLGLILGIISHTIILTSLITLIVVGLMAIIGRFTRIKSILQFLGTILIFFISLGFSYLVNSQAATTGIQTSVIASIVTKMVVFLKYIPTLGLLSKAIDGNLLALCGLILISVIIVYLVARLAEKPLLKGIQYNYVVGKRKKLSEEKKERAYEKKSVFWGLVRKDLRDILKTPVYLTNTLMLGIIIPIAFVAPFVAQKEQIMPLIEKLPDLYIMLESILSLDMVFAIALLGFIALMMFMASAATGVAGSSISREGKFFWITQSLPIEARKQVLSRIVSAIIIYSISLLPTTIILMVIAKPPFYLYIPYALAFISVAIFASCWGVFMDSLNPKFEWQTPQQVMKTNLTIFILSLSTMILSGICVFGVIKLVGSKMASNQMLIISLIAVASLIILGLIFYSLAIKRFKKLVNQQ